MNDRRSIVRAFGLDPGRVTDLLAFRPIVPLKDLEMDMRMLLLCMAVNGQVRGYEITAYIYHDRPIRSDEAIYIAFNVSKPHALAFVGHWE